MERHALTLELVAGSYTVARLDPGERLPDWAGGGPVVSMGAVSTPGYPAGGADVVALNCAADNGVPAGIGAGAGQTMTEAAFSIVSVVSCRPPRAVVADTL